MLAAGQALTIPLKGPSNSNNASMFRPYDPASAVGDLNPTSPKPPKNNKCGAFGQVLLVAIAVAVTAITAGAAAAAIGPAAGILGGLGSLAGGSLGVGAGVAIGAGSAAIGSIASQGVGVATGIQQQFSWKGVALSALSGGVSAGVGGSGLFSAIKSPVLQAGLNAATSSALTQGIGVVTGLQDKFDWAGVAAAGVGAGVSAGLARQFHIAPVGVGHNSIGDYAANLGVSMASSIAGAATRSVINGSDFGDNIMAGLPDVLGQTIGNMVANGVSGDGRPKTVSEPDETATPQTASGATPASSVVLTDAEKQRLLKAALPDAIAGIKTASTSTVLDAAELADVLAAAGTLGRKDTRYAYGAIPDQPTAGAAAGMENGRATITINLNSPSLFNTDGTVNMTTLSATLVHEGRHIYDARFYGERNGPSTVEQVRRTERNAYRTEAAYLKAAGGTMYIRDLTGATVPLTSANANIAAENSVKSWTIAAAKYAVDANVIIRRNNVDINRYNTEVRNYNNSTGKSISLKPLQIMRPIPVYRPPSSY